MNFLAKNGVENWKNVQFKVIIMNTHTLHRSRGNLIIINTENEISRLQIQAEIVYSLPIIMLEKRMNPSFLHTPSSYYE